ncbi:hypothetical protein E2C01_101507 [Portunus trituberculatus]|uniref:Uncharacterized protein n=1 Tax=Portunus trituberculatus TaxID=210409 RepID=A0A5B7KFW5_PORTR|nr:hypothetical protein [Portunus trituberculatus]
MLSDIEILSVSPWTTIIAHRYWHISSLLSDVQCRSGGGLNTITTCRCGCLRNGERKGEKPKHHCGINTRYLWTVSQGLSRDKEDTPGVQ